jgi:hypothetical protein
MTRRRARSVSFAEQRIMLAPRLDQALEPPIVQVRCDIESIPTVPGGDALEMGDSLRMKSS